jgi:hypothetical protein
VCAVGQIEDIERELMAIEDGFNLTSHGAGETIGKGALALISGRIQARDASQAGPGGTAWAANKAWARTNKLKRGKPVGVLSSPGRNSMLEALQIDGIQVITAHTALMVCGGSQAARNKADWFTNGSMAGSAESQRSEAKNQPPRPFYELDSRDVAALDGYFVDTFDAVLRRAGCH